MIIRYKTEDIVFKGTISFKRLSIRTLIAIQIFKNLIVLNCNSNKLTALDVLANTALRILRCYNNQLTYLDISENKALNTPYYSINQLTVLGVSKIQH